MKRILSTLFVCGLLHAHVCTPTSWYSALCAATCGAYIGGVSGYCMAQFAPQVYAPSVRQQGAQVKRDAKELADTISNQRNDVSNKVYRFIESPALKKYRGNLLLEDQMKQVDHECATLCNDIRQSPITRLEIDEIRRRCRTVNNIMQDARERFEVEHISPLEQSINDMLDNMLPQLQRKQNTLRRLDNIKQHWNVVLPTCVAAGSSIGLGLGLLYTYITS